MDEAEAVRVELVRAVQDEGTSRMMGARGGAFELPLARHHHELASDLSQTNPILCLRL